MVHDVRNVESGLSHSLWDASELPHTPVNIISHVMQKYCWHGSGFLVMLSMLAPWMSMSGCRQCVRHFWSRLKYLNNYWLDCHEICYRYS